MAERKIGRHLGVRRPGAAWPRSRAINNKAAPGAALQRKKFGPRFRVGRRQRGPSSTPSDEEGFTYGAWTDAKGRGRPDLVKESARTIPAG